MAQEIHSPMLAY